MRGVFRTALLLACCLAPAVEAQVITSLKQLTLATTTNQQFVSGLDLEFVVCAASRPEMGVVIAQDESGTELLQIPPPAAPLFPGERLRLHSDASLLRRRETGVQISPSPFVNNDGLHSRVIGTGTTFLRAGKIPVQVEWFNFWRQRGLDVFMTPTNEAPQIVTPTQLWHAVLTPAGATNFVPGLQAEYYEGAWEVLPNFNLFPPIKTAVVTNIDLNLRTRDEGIGIRYSGYLDVPRDGQYQFALWSDDGSMLFLGTPNVTLDWLGRTDPPQARSSVLYGDRFGALPERHWLAVAGRVNFVSPSGVGVRFDLEINRHVVSVVIADASGLDFSLLPGARVKVTGIGCAVIAADQSLVPGKLFAANAAGLEWLEPTPAPDTPQLPLTSGAQVQSLPIETARRALPVRIRGTVTGAMNTSQERWMSFQDETRGIFVNLAGISNTIPKFGERWEVEGRSAAGDFAPIVVAERLTRLGDGLLPAPVTPTWSELLNGSRDVQWAELTGLVTDVRSNSLSLNLPEGQLTVELDSWFENDLRPLQKAVVRIRGVLYAVWNATTREVHVGRVKLRGATISVDNPAPADPFDAVLRTPRELFLFDAQASAFRPVKVRGQITYSDAGKLFLQADGMGLKLLPDGPSEARPGDLVEAVGYPNISRTELVLRAALIKRTGTAPLPPPLPTVDSPRAGHSLHAIRVSVDGKLLGWHTEEGGPVLEMQSGNRLYLARVATTEVVTLSLRPGSRLALEGVYIGRGYTQGSEPDNESFELLLNSLADITVLAKPPWWTLPRLLTLLGVLLVILIFTVIWNTQLRRQVEQRTDELQHEIRARERLERQAALESERSRIARDLHDDLGSSLTEISVLASSGQLPQTTATGHNSLFQSISTRARSLIAALDVIVWAVDPEDNSLQSLADYLTGYTNDFFSHTQIACRFKVPVSVPPITLEGRVRHDLLMAVKEALNNIVRHAEATELEFRLDVVAHGLEIDIADNGKGIEDGAHSGGHGLKNLSARLKKLGGTCTIEPRSTGGTIVKFRLPLAPAAVSVPGPAANS
jgi:signal transduction histidine kinase